MSNIINQGFELRATDFYQSLLDDCKAVITEKMFNSRVEIIEGKWELGKRINEENEQMERVKIYGKRIIETLAEDLNVSTSNLWTCMQFYNRFPEKTFSKVLENLPEGKDISWYLIMTKYLTKVPILEQERKIFHIKIIELALRKWGIEKQLKLLEEDIKKFFDILKSYVSKKNS